MLGYNKKSEAPAVREMHTLWSNFISLTSLQLLTYCLPFITLPYLVRTLGVDKFGLVTKTQALAMFFCIFVDYGFNLSATQDVAESRLNNERLSMIFSSVITVKMILLLLSFLTLIVLTMLFKQFGEERQLYYVAFLAVVGQSLVVGWFFWGAEDVKKFTQISMFFKVFYTVSIFIFVNKPTDYILVPALNGLSIIFCGLWSMYSVMNSYNLKFRVLNTKVIYDTFRNGWQFFISRIANDGNHYLLTFIIGMKFGNYIVGYYSMAERLYVAFYFGIQPIIQVLYPKMVKDKDIALFKKITIPVTIFFAFLSLIAIIYSKQILMLFYGVWNETLDKIFLILFLSTFVGVANSFIGYPLLAAFGFKNHANFGVIFGAFFSVTYISVCCLVDATVYYYTGALLVYEVTGTMYRAYYVKKLMDNKK